MTARSFRKQRSRAVAPTEKQRATFASRLWSQMQHREVSVADLAEAAQVDPRTVRMWRDGSHLPKARELWLIAQRLDVTTDWLLGRGRDDAPERPGRRRSETYLVRELTAHVRAAALAGIRERFPGVEAHHLRVEGEALLATLTQDTVARAVREAERLQGRLESRALTDAIRQAFLHLSAMAASTLTEDRQRALARVMRTISEAERRLGDRSMWADGDVDTAIGLRSSVGLPVPSFDLEPLARLSAENATASERGSGAVPTSALPYLNESERLSGEEHQEALARTRAVGDERRERLLRALHDGFTLREEPPEADEREESVADKE